MAERGGLDVGGELLPVELEEANRALEARGEHGADAEHLVALAQAAHHLRVHALEGVRGKDGRRRAGVVVVGVVGAVLELLALVVAGEHWPRRQAARGLGLRLDEQEVEALPLVKPRQISARNIGSIDQSVAAL